MRQSGGRKKAAARDKIGGLRTEAGRPSYQTEVGALNK
jgi:hypothetical protein